jgi:hypothetical protein
MPEEAEAFIPVLRETYSARQLMRATREMQKFKPLPQTEGARDTIQLKGKLWCPYSFV